MDPFLTPALLAQLGIAAPIFALLTWFLKRSLTILDSRLAAIADKIGSGADTHRLEVREIEASHGEVVKGLIARERELTDRLLERSGPKPP